MNNELLTDINSWDEPHIAKKPKISLKLLIKKGETMFEFEKRISASQKEVLAGLNKKMVSTKRKVELY